MIPVANPLTPLSSHVDSPSWTFQQRIVICYKRLSEYSIFISILLFYTYFVFYVWEIFNISSKYIKILVDLLPAFEYLTKQFDGFSFNICLVKCIIRRTKVCQILLDNQIKRVRILHTFHTLFVTTINLILPKPSTSQKKGKNVNFSNYSINWRQTNQLNETYSQNISR